MPIKYTAEQKVEANKLRLVKQKCYATNKRYEQKLKKELSKPHCCKKFRQNFMAEVTEDDSYQHGKKIDNVEYFEHLNKSKLIGYKVHDYYGQAKCICEHDIKFAFLCEYTNDSTGITTYFNVGSTCIEKYGTDQLNENMKDLIKQHKREKYTCQYCNKICVHEKSGNAHDLFNVDERKCKECQSIPWCEVCKKEKKQKFYYPKCISCWKKCVK